MLPTVILCITLMFVIMDNQASKILKDLGTPPVEDTVKLTEQITFAKDTNAWIEKRKEDPRVAAVGKKNSKTLYQQDKQHKIFSTHFEPF